MPTHRRRSLFAVITLSIAAASCASPGAPADGDGPDAAAAPDVNGVDTVAARDVPRTDTVTPTEACAG